MRRTQTELMVTRALDRADSPVVVLDFDGVLARSGRNPAKARVTRGTRKAVAAVADRAGVVIVTGRDPLEARGLLGVPGVEVWGDYSIRRLRPLAHEPQALRPDLDGRAAELGDFVRAHVATLSAAGIVVSCGPTSACLHAGSGRQAARRWTILAQVAHSARDAGLHPVELSGYLDVRTGVYGKADAAEDLARAGDALICVGDDVSDIELWDALRLLPLRGLLCVGVIHADGPAERVAAAADVVVPGIHGVNDLLRATARQLARQG